jgi:hypothetical protein
MRSIIGSFIVAFAFLGGLSASAQDLGQLRARASKLWELRKQSNKLDALQFIEAQTRQTYLQWNESPIINFRLSGLQFTDDPNRVDMLVTVRSLLFQVGELDRTVQESWVWKDGQWFMQAISPPKLFQSAEKASDPVHIPPEFHVANTTVDIGRHAQGDIVEGKIPFQAVRRDIVGIAPLQKPPGLSIGAPVWTSASEGYLPYQWETVLLSQDVNQKIALEAKATSNERASVEIQFRARIDAKVGFKQMPEIVDPAKAGQVELQIQNLSTRPLKILSVSSYNHAYVVDDDVPESIEPGKSGRLLFRYAAQEEPAAAAIALALSEKLGPSPLTVVPLHIKMPESKPASYTREDLEKIRNAIPTPTLPFK